MEIATLIIAALGVLLGALSLGWQAATYVLTGGRVKIALKVGAIADSGTGMALMPGAEATPDKLASLGQQGFSRPVIAVSAQRRPTARDRVPVEPRVQPRSLVRAHRRLPRPSPAPSARPRRTRDVGRAERGPLNLPSCYLAGADLA